MMDVKERDFIFSDGLVYWQKGTQCYAQRSFMNKTITVESGNPFDAIQNIRCYLCTLDCKRLLLEKEIINKEELNKKMIEFITVNKFKEKYKVVSQKNMAK